MKRVVLLFFAVFLILNAPTQIMATPIILGIADSNISSSANDQFFTNLFSGDDVYGRTASTDWTLTNWSSRIAANGGNFTSGALSEGALVNKEWVATSTNVAWSAAELNLLTSFVAVGGSVVIIGEGPYYEDINNNANAILTALGSSMTFTVGGIPSTGTAIISDDPLMAGVTTFSGGYIGSITGGTALVTFSSPLPGQVVVAYETAAVVPEPATMLLLGSGLIGLAGFRRKKF